MVLQSLVFCCRGMGVAGPEGWCLPGGSSLLGLAAAASGAGTLPSCSPPAAGLPASLPVPVAFCRRRLAFWLLCPPPPWRCSGFPSSSLLLAAAAVLGAAAASPTVHAQQLSIPHTPGSQGLNCAHMSTPLPRKPSLVEGWNKWQYMPQ